MQKERFLLAMRVLLMHLLCEKACVLMEPCRLLILPAMKCALQMLVRVRLHLVKRGKMKKTKLNRKKTGKKKTGKKKTGKKKTGKKEMEKNVVADANVTLVIHKVCSLVAAIASAIADLVKISLLVLLTVQFL